MIVFLLITLLLILLYIASSKLINLNNYINNEYDIYPETEKEFNKIESDSIIDSLKEEKDKYINSEQTKEDWDEFVNNIKETLSDTNKEIDKNKIIGYLIENEYNNRKL